MDKKEVSIQSIKILMGKREVELSIEEAKKLKAALEEIFGVKVVEKTEHIHHYDHYRQYWPIWSTQYASEKKYDFGTVYCSTAKATNDTKDSIQMFNASNTLCLDIK